MTEVKRLLAEKEFGIWLPGELEYSARKAGYDKKIMRAAMEVDNPQSVHTFLSGEWFHFQLAHRQGVNYLPFHGKSAQLQLAKFSAGIFDKLALGNWLASGMPATADNFADIGLNTGTSLVAAQPWLKAEAADMDAPFGDTAFSQGVIDIMRYITQLAAQPNNMDAMKSLHDRTLGLGSVAAATYIDFASEFLNTDQMQLPVSDLAI